VEVLHRRLDVRVTHPLLDAPDVRHADDPRSERVAEVVEAERSQRGSFERGAVTLRKRRAVEVAADDAAENEVVLVGEVLPLAQPSERLCEDRTLPDFGVVRWPLV
jgi:hypothetical protein